MQTKDITLLDLIAVIDGERRVHQAAGLLSVNAEDRARYAHRARCEATAISGVRRNFARAHVSMHRPWLDDYVQPPD